MIPIPRNATLCEALYTDIDKDEYLLEIYDNLLYNYAVSLMKSDQPQREIPRKHALRFSDILPARSDSAGRFRILRCPSAKHRRPLPF